MAIKQDITWNILNAFKKNQTKPPTKLTIRPI